MIERTTVAVFGGALRDSRRLYEVLRDGKFVLLAPGAARPAMDGWRDRVVLASPVDATMPWTLVRPDAHIAWRGGPSTLRTALLQSGPSRERTFGSWRVDEFSTEGRDA